MTTMRGLGVAALGLALAWLMAAPAQAATRLGEGCDLAVVGAKDTGGFLQFDSALRGAVDRQDAAALAALVAFPLRVNRAGGGHVTLANAAALRGMSATLLPMLKAAVDSKLAARLFCNDGGVMYGDGQAWANLVQVGGVEKFRITAINLPEGAPATGTAAAAPIASGGKVQLACDTDKFHLVIDAGPNGAPHYRAWNRSHLPPAPPSMELTGTTGVEGTGPCAHRVWRFHNGNTEYLVSEPGCTESPVPQGTKAQLEVMIAGKSQLQAWCH